MLKRKNEDSDVQSDDQLNKRVALDSEQLESLTKLQDSAQTAPVINNGEEYNPQEQSENKSEGEEGEEGEEGDEKGDDKSDEKSDEKVDENHNAVDLGFYNDEKPKVSPSHQTTELQHTPEFGDYEPSKPVSQHRERDDPTFVLFRMFCPVKEASGIVGRRGDTINHIRDKSNVRISVSENLKGVPERIVLVRGSSENVAQAFGLITRTILDEPEDEASSMSSRLYNLRLLIPHPMVGYIIGKQGSKFREIEESSAAKLKAAEQPLPYSTDRILSISGVSDAIHIAVYYVAQVWLEHKDCLKKNKIVFYNPANYHPSSMNAQNTLSSVGPSNGGIGSGGGPGPGPGPMGPGPMASGPGPMASGPGPMASGPGPMASGPGPMASGPGPMGSGPGPSPGGLSPGMANMGGVNNMNTMNALNALSNLSNLNNMMVPPNNMQPGPGGPPAGSPYGQPMKQQPYNFQMMFQPAVPPQQQPPPQNHYGGSPSMGMGNDQPPQYTDEHGNNMVGEVVVNPPIPVSNAGDKYNEDVYVSNETIGSVIGKGGNNIKQIRETSGCTYVKIEPDKGQTMLLGGGRGITNIRRLTLTGSINSINTAIYLINQRINTDKGRNFN